jgi:hypothetical protein
MTKRVVRVVHVHLRDANIQHPSARLSKLLIGYRSHPTRRRLGQRWGLKKMESYSLLGLRLPVASP